MRDLTVDRERLLSIIEDNKGDVLRKAIDETFFLDFLALRDVGSFLKDAKH